jgi:hypothetical protein
LTASEDGAVAEGASGAGFSDEERRALARVLDEIIPPSPDARLPGAGELGLAGHLEGVARRTPEFRALVARTLAALNEIARSRGSAGFVALSGEGRGEALRELEAGAPELLPGLVFHTYTGYYQAARVVEALGLEARPPHPRGHSLEPGDLSLLEAVRRRPKLYRDC